MRSAVEWQKLPRFTRRVRGHQFWVFAKTLKRVFPPENPYLGLPMPPQAGWWLLGSGIHAVGLRSCAVEMTERLASGDK